MTTVMSLIGIGVFVVFVTLIIFIRQERPQIIQDLQSPRISIFTGVAYLVGLVLLLLIFLVPAILYFYLQDSAEVVVSFFKGPGGIFAIVIFGYSLYVLRQREGVVYGMLEVGAGVVTGIVVAHNAALGFDGLLAALLAAAYIIVRGLDNIRRGLDPTLHSMWDKFFFHK